MDTIFTLSENTDNTKLNLDELYEKKQKHDMNTLQVFNRILNRIYNKIKHISKQHVSNQFCWYVIPEIIIGLPRYNHSECTAFIIDQLKNNGLNIKYTHPNLLLISWKHWIPSYVRNEIKKKTGNNIDGYGNKIKKKDDPQKVINDIKKTYKSVDTYKPSGGLIYNKDLLRKIEESSTL